MATQTNKKHAAKPVHVERGPRYAWRNIQQVERGDIIVVAGHEIRIQSIQQRDGCWWVSYTLPGTESKTEALYHVHDSLYVQISKSTLRSA